MKILFLSDANSAHTQRWIKYLHAHNIQLSVWSLSQPRPESAAFFQSIHVPVFFPHTFFSSKILYPLFLPSLKRAIKTFKPDIIHAHYASSYGLLGALSHFHPLVISVWGSDVYDFPKINSINKKILQFNLSAADHITSTSHCMANETKKYTQKNITVIPFGIDTDFFYPNPKKTLFDKNDIVIGIIKTLSEKYGIDKLIRAFALVKKQLPRLPVKLLIVGDGHLKQQYIQLCRQLNIDHLVLFTGYVPNAKIPEYLNELDIYVSLSQYESFGVSAIEAMACEIPVILSDIPAFREITHHRLDEWIVPKEQPEKTAERIKKLIMHPELRTACGKTGRLIVKEHYDIRQNVRQLMNIYSSLI